MDCRGCKEDVDNWIVSEIVYDDDKKQKINQQRIISENQNEKPKPKGKINKIVFKPLDVSPYCRPLFELADITLIMSATILDVDTFCRNIGLDRE